MSRNYRPVVGALVGVLSAVLVIAVLAMMVRTWSVTDAIRETQKVNTGLSNQSRQTLKAVQSCTTPGEACYVEGERRTAKAVGNINQVIILAAACSAGLPPHLTVPDRQARISTCVIKRLAATR